MNIIKATAEDLEGLSSLFNSYRIFYGYPDEIDNVTTFISERVRNNDSVIYVAKSEDGALAGFVQLYPLFSSTRMKRLWLLNDLFVDPQFRGMKVSVMLIDRAKQLARDTQAAGLVLETAQSNSAGNNLYVKTNFVLDRDHNYYSWSY